MPLIRVTSFDGTVIFEGEGEIRIGLDPALPDPGMTVGFLAREGDYRAQADLTGLVQTTRHELRYEIDEPDVMEWSPDPTSVCIPVPQVARTTLLIDVPSSFALSMRQELYAGHPQVRGGHGSPVDRVMPGQGERFTADMARTEMNRLRDAHYARLREPLNWSALLSSETFAGPSMREALALYGEAFQTAEEVQAELQAAWATEPSPDYDELIASTRAEFPYDPHHYDHPETNEMRWSPPEGEEKVTRCP